MCTNTLAKSIFLGFYNKSKFNIVRFDKNPFTYQCKKKKKAQGFKFRTFIGRSQVASRQWKGYVLSSFYIYIYMRIHCVRHTNIHTRSRTNVRAHTDTHKWWARGRVVTYQYPRGHTHTAHTQTRARARAYTHTHTHTHTYTHTPDIWSTRRLTCILPFYSCSQTLGP